MRSVRSRIATAAILVAVALVAWFVLRPARTGTESGEVIALLRAPRVAPDSDETARLWSATRRTGTAPAGTAFLRMPLPNGRVGWNGRRAYELEVLACPGDLVRVTVAREGRVEQRLEGFGERRAVPLVLHPPFWGRHTYRIDVEIASGGVLSHDLDLAGTLHVDPGAYFYR